MLAKRIFDTAELQTIIKFALKKAKERELPGSVKR